MTYTTHIAAITTAIDTALAAQAVASGNKTPLKKELQAACGAAIEALEAAGTIQNGAHVTD